MGSYLFAPLMQGDKIIGSLNLYARSEKKFGGEVSTDFIKDLSSIASVSMQKMYNTEVIFKQTRTDFLTGAYNKLAMTEFLEIFMSKYIRHDQGFVFILMDIDNFKQINDTAGHLTGDTIIKDISDEIKDGLRTSDILGRFGGDEFYMLVPYANIESLFCSCGAFAGYREEGFLTLTASGMWPLCQAELFLFRGISQAKTQEKILYVWLTGGFITVSVTAKDFFTGV